MTILISVFVFYLVMLFQFLVPGFVFVDRFIQLKLQTWEKVTIGLLVSIVVQTALLFLLTTVFGTGAYLIGYIFLLIGLWQFRQLRDILALVVVEVKQHLFLFTFALVLSFSLAGTLAFTWLPVSGGISLQAGQLHDSVWHLALIQNLMESIPPEHPSSYVVLIENYHYFYDLFLAGVINNFSLNIEATYFQAAPLLLSLLLATTCVMVCKRVFRLKSAAYFSLFFIFLGGNFSYILPLFLDNFQWHDSSFWVSQTFSMMGNPQLVLSFSFVLLFIVLLYLGDTRQKSKKILKLHALLWMLAVPSLGFKSYSFVLISVLYALYLGCTILSASNRKIRHLLVYAGLGYTAVSLPFLLLLLDFSKPSFIYMPLWYLSSMIESHDRVYHPVWRLLEDHYLATGNTLRVIEIKLKELLLFYFGNLGSRSLFLFLPILFWKKRSEFHKKTALLLAGFVISSVFPLLFLQAGVVWNSIQFWYYSLLFASLLTGLFLAKLWGRLKQPPFFKWILVVILAIVTIPTTVQTASIKFSQYEVLSTERRNLLQSIPADSRLLICPTNDVLFDTALVSFWSKSQVLLANPVQLNLLQIEPRVSEEELVKYFSTNNSTEIKSIIDNYEITYIACSEPSWELLLDELGSGRLITADGWYLKQIKL